MKAVVILAGIALISAATARGQGLLAIGAQSDYKANVPLTFQLNLLGGYDQTTYKLPSLNAPNVDSFFVQGGVGAIYAKDDHITRFTADAGFDTIYYFDKAENGKQTFYNAKIDLGLQHAYSRRLTVTDNLYAAYEIEPDYTVGASDAQRSGQYFYGYNNFAVSYAWSDRFATTTSWTISDIRYQDRSIGQLEDRISDTVSQQFSYKLSRTTSLTAEYRFEYTDYNSFSNSTGLPNPNYTAHYLLVGVDQAWSPRTTASARVGAEFYQSDRVSNTAPYLEASLNYALSRTTGIRWYNQLGYDGSQLGDYDSRYTFHSGLTATHQFTERFSGNAGINYVHSNYQGNATVASAKEDEINASLGMSYKLWKSLAIQANYSYTTIASDIAVNEFDRHYATLGVNASF